MANAQCRGVRNRAGISNSVTQYGRHSGNGPVRERGGPGGRKKIVQLIVAAFSKCRSMLGQVAGIKNCCGQNVTKSSSASPAARMKCPKTSSRDDSFLYKAWRYLFLKRRVERRLSGENCHSENLAARDMRCSAVSWRYYRGLRRQARMRVGGLCVMHRARYQHWRHLLSMI